MDRERGRDSKRSVGSGGRSLHAKRRALTGRISSSSTKSTTVLLSSIPSEKEKVAVSNGSSYGGGGGGEESAMERWKKEKAKAFEWGSGIDGDDGRTGDRGGTGGSDGGERHLSLPPLSRSVGPRSKVSEDGNAVGPAVVPRKLRSAAAMNKRNRLSASPRLPYSRNKCRASSHGNRMPRVNGARSRKREDVLNEPVTKDEEEAAQTLSAMAGMIPNGGAVRIGDDGRMSEENSQTAAAVVSHLQASKEGNTKILLPSTGLVATNPSSQIEESAAAETAKPEPSALEQPAITSGNRELGPGSNGTAQPDFQRAPPPKNEQATNASLRDSSNSSNLLEASPYSYCYCANRSAQSNDLSVHKPEIRPWQFESAASAEHQVGSFKQKADRPAHYTCGEDASLALRPGLPSNDDGHLATSSSSKAALRPDSAAARCRTNSNGVCSNRSGLPTGKVPADRRSSGKRCATHVYISHIIQRCRKTEIKHRFPALTDRSKAKERTNPGVQESNEAAGISSLNSMTSAGNNGSMMESTDESRIQMLSGSHMQQQQLPRRIGNSPYGPYGPPIAVAGGKLQQIWQAHLARYRPPLGMPAWQAMRLQDPSLLPCAQPPSAFPQRAGEVQVRYRQSPSSHQLQELLPIPSSSSSSSLGAKKPHGGGFGTGGEPQLQLLCNAQRM